MFVALLMVGCGGPDLDDGETLIEIIAGATELQNLKYKPTKDEGEEGEGEMLLYILDTDTPYTGWMKSIFGNGKLRQLAQFKNGKSHGPIVLWHENGVRAGSGHFEDGIQEGVWMTWNDGGEKEQEGSYEDGKREGSWMTLIDKPAGYRLRIEETYENGLPHGKRAIYSKRWGEAANKMYGKEGIPEYLVFEGEYKNGKLVQSEEKEHSLVGQTLTGVPGKGDSWLYVIQGILPTPSLKNR